MLRFTAEFGMGSGGSKALWSSSKKVLAMSTLDWLTAHTIIRCCLTLPVVINITDGIRYSLLVALCRFQTIQLDEVADTCFISSSYVSRYSNPSLKKIALALYGQAARVISTG